MAAFNLSMLNTSSSPAQEIIACDPAHYSGGLKLSMVMFGIGFYIYLFLKKRLTPQAQNVIDGILFVLYCGIVASLWMSHA